MIRVVVVDDSPTARALLVEILSGDPDIQVIGEARDGAEGVEMVQRLRPDVVTMDVHMPRLDGIAATKEIMITAPTPIVVATGSQSAGEVEVAVHALRAGAVAVVCKPRGPGCADFDQACQKLCATIKTMSEVKVVRRWRIREAEAIDKGQPLGVPPGPSGRARIVAVATSTGGPAALQTMLAALPGDFSVPILVVQHITPGFTQGLAGWLNSVCDLQVKVAEHGERLAAHTVYLAPDGRHLGVCGPLTVALDDGPPLGGFRPSGTFLFSSVAKAFGASAVAVILTGMGDDGVAGLRSVRLAGGRTIAQDEKSCVVFGMPGSAIAAGLADLVLSPEQIAVRLTQLV
jgi:two-component system chemotaxis response regulator CheB